MQSTIDIYVGGEDAARSLPISPVATASELIERVRAAGVPVAADAAVFAEEATSPSHPATPSRRGTARRPPTTSVRGTPSV